MGAKLSHGGRGRWYRWLTQAVLVAACWAGAAAAQTTSGATAPESKPVIMEDGNRQRAWGPGALEQYPTLGRIRCIEVEGKGNARQVVAEVMRHL